LWPFNECLHVTGWHVGSEQHNTSLLRIQSHGSRRLCWFTHIDNITSCARVLYGLRTLRSHGIPPPAVHAVFQSSALAKVTYASLAWWGFTNSADRNRLEAFIRRAVRHGYCTDTTPALSSLCDKADQALFDNIITNSTHPLHSLLPPKVQKHYSTRPRGHCYQLPRKTSVLDENNFFYRVLYRDILSFKSTD